MKLIFAIMESTEMPEFLHRGNMDDDNSDAAGLRAISDDESLTAEASNSDLSPRKNAFEQKCGINVIVHADENNSDSDVSASNFSPHSDVVNGVSELSKDGISEEESKEAHFNTEPRNGMNKDEDSIDDFSDVGREFSSQDIVPKTLGLKDDISESGDGDDCSGSGDHDDGKGDGDGTALKCTGSNETVDDSLDDESSNPKTNLIQEIVETNEQDNTEKKWCSSEAPKSEFDNEDDDSADGDDGNNVYKGGNAAEKITKPSIVEDYLSDNSSDKEISKVFSDDESGEGKLENRQFKELSSDTSSEGETAKGDTPTDGKFKEIEKDISSEDDSAKEATLEAKQQKEMLADNSSEDETVGDSLDDEVYSTEKCNASSEHIKDEISEDESIKSNLGGEGKEDSLEKKTLSYDDTQHSSEEEYEKTDASDDESDGGSSDYSSPQEDGSYDFDEHVKHSGDEHISSSDSEPFDNISVEDSEEKSSHSHDFKHQTEECSLSPGRHKYKDVRKEKDETFSEDSYDDKALNSSSEDVKSHKYLSQEESCEVNDVETEINKGECERTALRDFQRTDATEDENSTHVITDNKREEIKELEEVTSQTDTEKPHLSSNIENQREENYTDLPLSDKDVKCEISEEESSEVAPNHNQESNTSFETKFHGGSILESEDNETAVLNKERNLINQTSENVLKENTFENSPIRNPEDENDAFKISYEEKPLKQEAKSMELEESTCLSKENSSEHEYLKHEDNRDSSDSEENNFLGKGTDGNQDTAACVLKVSDDDKITNSPPQILQDNEQKDLGLESVHLSTELQDNQSDDGCSSQFGVKVESTENVAQKDDSNPCSCDVASVANEELDNSVNDLVSLGEVCKTETLVDINVDEHETEAKDEIIENNDKLFKSEKENKIHAIQEHSEECGTMKSLVSAESEESDVGSREIQNKEANFEETVCDTPSDLQKETSSAESSRTISLEDKAAGVLSCRQHVGLVSDKETVCAEDNGDLLSDGHEMSSSSHLAVSELKDKTYVGEIDSADSTSHISCETGESEADNSKRSLLGGDNPENYFADSADQISLETNDSEVDKSKVTSLEINNSENLSEVVPQNTAEKQLEHFVHVKSDTPDQLENEDTVNDRNFYSDDTTSGEVKQEEEEDKEDKEQKQEAEEQHGDGEEKEQEQEKEAEQQQQQEEEKHEEIIVGDKLAVATHRECDSVANLSSQNSMEELVQKSSICDSSKDNQFRVEILPATRISRDIANEASDRGDIIKSEEISIERVTGTDSHFAAEESESVDVHPTCSKEVMMDYIEDGKERETDDSVSIKNENGVEVSDKNVGSERLTGVVTLDSATIQSENVQTPIKIEVPLTNGTDCQQILEDGAKETHESTDTITGERQSNQSNIVNDKQSEQTSKKTSILENETANDCVSQGDQINNDSRKRKISSSPEDESVLKEGCSRQFKGFKKRILAQASLEVADEHVHHQHQTLPKPEELQPDLGDSLSTPLTEYAQYLGLQPIVKFKCYLCGETGFPSILSLQEHQSSCLKTSRTRPVPQQPAVPDMVTAEGDCPAEGMAAATAAGPADVSGAPSTNFRITRKVYLCSVCGTYYENWNLFLHMKEMHRRFICLFCLSMFTDAGMLATHLSSDHSVTDRLYDTQEGFRAEIADEACFLVCCDCERIFAHTDNFYEHVCPTPPSIEKHLQHQQPQEPKQLQKHRRQQQKQKQLEQNNQHIQGVCTLCGLRGAHFPTCRRASSNSNALTTLVDGSGAVAELSPLDGEHQAEKQPVAKTDTTKKRTGKGKTTAKTLPSGDIDAEVDGDEDYDISHAASFCQINIHETPADKPKTAEQSSSLTPVAKVTIKTKNLPTTALSNNSATKKNSVSMVKQESTTSVTHSKLDQTLSATPESQRPKKTTDSATVTVIKPGKRGASSSPVPMTEGKKPKFDQVKDHVKVEDTDEHRGQASSPVPESDSSSSHSQDSDRLHINTQESESVDGQSCADEEDTAVKETIKAPEVTDADKTEETSSSEKQLTSAATKTLHPKQRTSESESDSSGSANGIPSHKSEDSSSSSEAEAASSNEERKQETAPETVTKQTSEDMSDDGGGTAEEPESGGEESSKDSPALVVDEEAADCKKDSESGTSQPATVAEGGDIQVAGDDVPALELTLEEQPEAMTLQALVKECVRVSCNSCVFCNHAKKIAVNGSQLALHLLAEHRFEPVVCTDTADLKPVAADGFTARLKEAVHNLHEAFFNTDSYDNTADQSEASSAEQADGSHVYDRSYECFHCHFVTTLHKELYVHNRKMHQKTILLCVMCKSNFYSYSELLCHICPGLYAPDADISFRCCLCSVDKLPSAFRLMVHLRKRHHACDVCLEATGDQQRLSNHVWKHKLHHLCYRCGIAYRNKPDITKHLFWKHGTESVLCKKCLQKKWPHVYHFCIPPTAFNCEECGTSFARAVALKVHRRLHSGDRPYTCEDCSDSFISRKLLARHRRLKHAPPEPSPPPPPPPLPPPSSSLEKNATTHSEREFPAALDKEASTVRDSETDQNKSNLENKMSISSDKRTGNQVSGPGEKQSEDTVKKNKVMDVYDLPPLNLSSDSDDSDEPDTKDSKPVTSPAAVSASEVKDSEKEVKPEPPVSDSVVGEEEEPAPVQIIDGIWDNFKNYKASLERKEQEAAAVATGSYSTSHAIEVIMSDHDYCVVSKPSNLGTVDDSGSVDDASLHTAGGLPSADGPDVSDKTVEGDKDSGSNTDSSPETMEATDSGSRSKAVAADSGSAVPASAGGLQVLAGTEKTLTQLSDTGRAPGVATEAASSVVSGTPPQPSNASATTSSKKRTKQARKRQKREGASSSSSSSSSDSDSSSCSCGTNCSCSSSSSSSSGSSSSSSDSDSSTSEGRRRQAARRERRRERARKKAVAATADTAAAASGEAATEPANRTPVTNSVPAAQCDTERERADGVIHESDLDTDETETDEDFYDQHPQRQANRLLAEKRNRLMLLAAVAPASNGTAQLAQQLQELNQQQQQQHQEQHQYQRQEEAQQQQQLQQQQDDQQRIQPVPPQQTLQQPQPQQRVRIGSGTVSGDSRKVRTRKRKRAVPADARTGSASLAASAETAVRPLGSLTLTTYRDSSGVVTQTSIPESASVQSATSAVRTTGGSGSEGESKRLSKRRRVPKRFYGDSSDEDGEAPVTPQPKWRKTGSGGSGGGGGSGASVASVGAPATPSHVPEPPHLPIRQQVTLPSAAALLSSARSVAAGRRPVDTMGHSSSSSSSSSSGSDDADSNYESASDGGGGAGGGSAGVGVSSVTSARTGGAAGAEMENSGSKSENLYCYCQCPYDEVSEMIACDGKDCQIEWFHFECVGIMVPPKGKWFCPDCRKKSSASRGGEYLLHA